MYFFVSDGWWRDPKQFWPLLFTETFAGRHRAPSTAKRLFSHSTFYL